MCKLGQEKDNREPCGLCDQLSQHHLLNEYSFLIELSSYPVKNQLFINMRVYFWTISSVPLIYMSILVAVPHSLDYYSFVILLKSVNVNLSTLFSFTKIFFFFFAYSRSLEFPYEF